MTQADTDQGLRAELEAVRRREAELRELLAEAHRQLAERDEELVQSALNHRRIDEMRRTRIWRTAVAWWGFKERARGVLRRGRPEA